MLEDLGCQCESFQHPPPNQHHPSLESFMRFCISFIDSIINAINSNDFSVNAADESPADVFSPLWGSAASLDLWEPLPLPSGGLSASLPEPVVTPTAGRCELMGFLGVYRPPFGGSFKLAIRAIWSYKPLIFIQLLKLQRIYPFPQELILPQNFFQIPSQFSIFSIYIHASIMSMSMKAAGPNPALLMHSSFILFKEKRSLDRRQELPRWHQRQGRELEGHVVDIAMVLVHTVLSWFSSTKESWAWTCAEVQTSSGLTEVLRFFPHSQPHAVLLHLSFLES